ncbi:c-type cytochrome [Halomonas sp. BM-2019]|uniref:c-type cytochrome n=1 Tax=Halomonas sp. BM-2019 TaxID=2811227 RepID=UPI001B3C2F5D|nr:MAG: cytochrome c [Halomonas sp. BM-2019]
MSASVSPKPRARATRYLPLALLAALALSGPLPAHDDGDHTHDHGHGDHAHAHDHGDHAHDHGDHAHDHGDHAHDHGDHAHDHGDHARQAPPEWLERDNPLPPSADNLAFGQETYARYCAVCHGETGRGDGVAAGVAGFVPVPTDLAQHGAAHGAGEYAWLVKEGNPQSAMPRFDGKLGEDAIWAVVLYVRHILAAGDEGHEADGHAH